MKKVLFGAMLIAMFASCNKSLEEKANVLIEKNIKKMVYHPESYDPTETRIDSAFTPFDDPDFYEKTMQLYKLGMAIDEYDKNMKDAKSSMSIWSGPYQSSFGRNEYQEAKEEYTKNAKNKKSTEEKARKLADELKSMLDKEKVFIGFKVQHRFRINNNAGQTTFGEMEFLFDKNMSEIFASYDMDSEEYKAVQIFYKQMRGEEDKEDIYDSEFEDE